MLEAVRSTHAIRDGMSVVFWQLEGRWPWKNSKPSTNNLGYRGMIHTETNT